MSSYLIPTEKEKAQILKNYTYTDTLYLNGVEVVRELSHVPGSHVPGAKIMNVRVIIGVLTGKPPVRGNFCNVKPKYTTCEECGEELTEEDIRMMACMHEKCWRDMVHAGWDKGDEERAKRGDRE